MKTVMIRRIALGILVLVGLSSGSAWAQRYPERRVLRSGNSLYEKKQYPEAETKYRKAQDMNPTYEGGTRRRSIFSSRLLGMMWLGCTLPMPITIWVTPISR